MAKETTGQLQVYNRYLRRKRTALAVVCAAAIEVALYAVGVGSIPISVPEVIQVLLGGGEEMARTAVLNIRLPRVVAAILVGAALASAGAVMQCVLRNPLASASTLGVSQGAAFGARRWGLWCSAAVWSTPPMPPPPSPSITPIL